MGVFFVKKLQGNGLRCGCCGRDVCENGCGFVFRQKTEKTGNAAASGEERDFGVDAAETRIAVQVQVENRGTADTRDVVQIYVKNPDFPLAVPNPELP